MMRIFLTGNYALLCSSALLFCLGFYLSVKAETVKQDYLLFKGSFSISRRDKLKKKLLVFIREHRLMSFLEIEDHCVKLKKRGDLLVAAGGLVFFVTLSLKFLY